MTNFKVAAKHNTDEQEKAPGTMYLAAFFFFNLFGKSSFLDQIISCKDVNGGIHSLLSER